MKNIFPKVEENVDIKPLTTFGVGGHARWYLRVSTPEELTEVYLKAITYNLSPILMAGGSNLVFPDETYPGLLIHYLASTEAKPRIIRGLASVACEGGLSLASFICFAIENNLAGLEALSGIPGTVGGAIVGNAGAYGQGISDKITRVEVFDGKEVKWLAKSDCHFIYRDSFFKKEGKDWLVLRAEWQLESGSGEELKKKSEEIIKIRNAKYVPGTKCPGSYFKNVLVEKVSAEALAKIDQSKIRDGKIPAGYLLEEVRAKGLRVGEAVVANFHGNLIINEGRATYVDVRALAEKLKNLVKKKFGIELDEEVRYMVG